MKSLPNLAPKLLRYNVSKTVSNLGNYGKREHIRNLFHGS